MVNNRNYCIYCGNLNETDNLTCMDCWFKPNKRKSDRQFCIECGCKLDRKGLACKNCYFGEHMEKKKEIYERDKDKISMRAEIKQEKKNPSCMYKKGRLCTNKNLCFQGHKFTCDLCPRTECPHFKAKRPELLKFIEELNKMKGGIEEDEKES